MISDSIQKFQDSNYFQGALKGEKLETFTKNIYLDRKVQFSYNRVSFDEFQHKPRSLLERVVLCPIELLISAVQIAYVALGALHLLTCALFMLTHTMDYYFTLSPADRPPYLKSLSEGIPAEIWEEVKVCVFTAARGFESLTGTIVGLVSDKAGNYLRQEAQFQGECYEAFSRRNIFLDKKKLSYSKISAHTFINQTSEDHQKVIRSELMTHPQMLDNYTLKQKLENTFLLEEDELYKQAQTLDAELLKLIPITNFTKNSPMLKYALLDEVTLNHLTLKEVLNNGSWKKAAPIISHRLVAKETVDTLPANAAELTLSQIRGLTKEQIDSLTKNKESKISRLILLLVKE